MTETPHRRTRRITSTHGREIADQYAAGGSLSEVGKTWGISVQAVSDTIKRHGVQTRPGGPRPSENGESQRAKNRRIIGENWEAIVAAYRTQTMEEIARAFGIDRGALHRHLKEAGVKIRPRGARQQQFGAANPAFKNGRYANSDGYIKVLLAPDDPFICMADAKRYVSEHRIVMARMIGRPLLADETVHHIDGDRANNAPGNLQLRRGQHGKHVHIRCHDCGSQNVGPAPI